LISFLPSEQLADRNAAQFPSTNSGKLPARDQTLDCPSAHREEPGSVLQAVLQRRDEITPGDPLWWQETDSWLHWFFLSRCAIVLWV
jgi:hypothetical protein